MSPSIVLSTILVLLASDCYESILVGSHESSINKTIDESADSRVGQSNQDSNITFHYEANEFLQNPIKKIPNDSRKEPQLTGRNVEKPTHTKTDKKLTNQIPVPPDATSARNGRMLDLDALVGDIAASQQYRQRSNTGNRQSRFLAGTNLDVGGKKLQIQGFIPIVGVKDETNDDQDHLVEREHGTTKQVQSSSVELPYAQSSTGHASFGVQRYLQSEQASNSAPISTPMVTKSSSLVDSLKRPLKRLAGTSGESSTGYQQRQQDCLCVPFYMCKGGYISESSITKSQIQQLMAQQQQPQTPRQIQDEATSLNSMQISQQVATNQAQYADSIVPVDERSLDRDLISPAGLSEAQYQNESSISSPEMLIKQNPQDLSDETTANNSSLNPSQSGDYTQEILGRMLGLKSTSPSRMSSPAQFGGASTSQGSCGLLRTCCTISPFLLSGINQPETFGDMITSAQLNIATPQNQNVYQQQQQQQQPKSNQRLASAYQQMQFQAAQSIPIPRYQIHSSPQTSPTQSKPSAYGSLAQGANLQLQPLNSPSSMYPDLTPSLAHRSTQFQSLANQYPQLPSTSVIQNNRVSPQMLPSQSIMQAYQQQQVKALARPQSTNLAPIRSQSLNSGLGTRKILEGRCGLRQSSGITGRVQNLQYHESSADFGEYPAQAAILKRLSGSDSLFVCGGTLVSQYWVATAAHCIKKHAQSELKVRLGEWDVHRDDEFYPFIEKEVRDIVVHPEFVAGNLVNDVALLRLDSPVDSTLPHVNPACLPTLDESFARQRCWVTGWGKDSFGQKGSFQSVLQEVELPVVGQSECEMSLRQTRLGPHYRLHSGFICAGGEGGRDACEGDGGSGLYCLHDGVIKVAGLVSWGIGCGQAGVPGVYVNLAYYRPWIENIISIDEDIYSPYSNMIGGNAISERSHGNKTDDSTNSSTMINPTIPDPTTEAPKLQN